MRGAALTRRPICSDRREIGGLGAARIRLNVERDFLAFAQSWRTKTREALQRQPGVLTVQPMGVDLHLFLNPALTSPEKLQAITPFEYQKIQPSLEDVFIALVRRQEMAHAA